MNPATPFMQLAASVYGVPYWKITQRTQDPRVSRARDAAIVTAREQLKLDVVKTANLFEMPITGVLSAISNVAADVVDGDKDRIFRMKLIAKGLPAVWEKLKGGKQ